MPLPMNAYGIYCEPLGPDGKVAGMAQLQNWEFFKSATAGVVFRESRLGY